MTQVAKVFWSGRSQAVRLPKEFRFDTDSVSIRREGGRVILQPLDTRPDGYVASFAGIPTDFERPAQGTLEPREPVE